MEHRRAQASGGLSAIAELYDYYSLIHITCVHGQVFQHRSVQLALYLMRLKYTLHEDGGCVGWQAVRFNCILGGAIL